MSRLERSRRRRSNVLARFLIIPVLFLAILILFYFGKSFLLSKFNNPKQKLVAGAIISPPPTLTPTQTPVPSPTPLPTSNSLGEAVQGALSGTHGTYGVVVENLKTGENYLYNQHEVFASGSLYKLWVMATVYEKIKDGTLTEDQTISEDIPTLNSKFDIDPENAEKTTGVESDTVSDALYQMITISDNYSALLLTEKVGLSNVANFLSDNVFSESKVGTNGDDPTTTPSDIALFFDKLYKGELADPTYTEKMLDLLKQQKLNEKIPEYLPTDLVIAHKTGELDDATHDAGIIYATTGDYILAVLSKSDDPQLANERIAGISRAVYNYFTNAP